MGSESLHTQTAEYGRVPNDFGLAHSRVMNSKSPPASFPCPSSIPLTRLYSHRPFVLIIVIFPGLINRRPDSFVIRAVPAKPGGRTYLHHRTTAAMAPRGPAKARDLDFSNVGKAGRYVL